MVLTSRTLGLPNLRKGSKVTGAGLAGIFKGRKGGSDLVMKAEDLFVKLSGFASERTSSSRRLI